MFVKKSESPSISSPAFQTPAWRRSIDWSSYGEGSDHHKHKIFLVSLQSLKFTIFYLSTGSPSSLYGPHKQNNMASNYKGLYGIFYKTSMEVVKSENSQ